MQTTCKFSQPIVGTFFILFLLCLALLFVSGCGNSQHPSALVGKWECNVGPVIAYTNFELLKGGAGIVGRSQSVEWRVEGGRLFVGTEVAEYEVSEGTLTLKTDRGSTTYTRK